MEKLTWLCKRSGLTDELNVRCILLFNLRPAKIQELARKHDVAIVQFLKEHTKDKHLHRNIYKNMPAITVNMIEISSIVYILAAESFTCSKIYADIWQACEMLFREAKKYYKRNTNHAKISVYDGSGALNESILALLRCNLLRTDIVNKSIEQCENTLKLMPDDYVQEINIQSQSEPISGMSLESLESIARFHRNIMIDESFIIAKLRSDKFNLEITNSQLKKALKESEREINLFLKINKEYEITLKEKSIEIENFNRSRKQDNETECKTVSTRDYDAAYIHSLQNKLKKTNDDLAKLYEQYSEAQTKLDNFAFIEELFSGKEKDVDDSKEFCEEDLAHELKGYRILVFGGKDNWRRSIKSYAEQMGINLRVAESLKVKRNSNDIIIFNIVGSSHSEVSNFKDQFKDCIKEIEFVYALGASRIPQLLQECLDNTIRKYCGKLVDMA